MVLLLALVLLVVGIVLIFGAGGWQLTAPYRQSSDEEYERLNDRRDWD